MITFTIEELRGLYRGIWIDNQPEADKYVRRAYELHQMHEEKDPPFHKSRQSEIRQAFEGLVDFGSFA